MQLNEPSQASQCGSSEGFDFHKDPTPPHNTHPRSLPLQSSHDNPLPFHTQLSSPVNNCQICCAAHCENLRNPKVMAENGDIGKSTLWECCQPLLVHEAYHRAPFRLFAQQP